MTDLEMTKLCAGEGEMETIHFTNTPIAVGYYNLGAVHLHVTKRPNWFQQKMIAWCFGWKWVDQ